MSTLAILGVIAAFLSIIATVVIFIVAQWRSDKKFKLAQELQYNEFKTETNFKLIQFEKEIAIIKAQSEKEFANINAKLVMTKEEIINTYKEYKDETVTHTLQFRDETNSSLKDNKFEHEDFKRGLTQVMTDVSFIRGKLSTKQENDANGGSKKRV